MKSSLKKKINRQLTLEKAEDLFAARLARILVDQILNDQGYNHELSMKENDNIEIS